LQLPESGDFKASFVRIPNTDRTLPQLRATDDRDMRLVIITRTGESLTENVIAMVAITGAQLIVSLPKVAKSIATVALLRPASATISRPVLPRQRWLKARNESTFVIAACS